MRHAEHAAEHGSAERLTHLGAGAGGDHQRQHAENEGERGHQDRPQAHARRFGRRLEAVLAVLLVLPRELHDQNCVLGRETDQHDEADLGEDVHVHGPEQKPGHRGEQAHRHDQNHGERQRPALILRGEQQEHEHHRGQEHVDGRVAGELLLDRRARSRRRNSRRAGWRCAIFSMAASP